MQFELFEKHTSANYFQIEREKTYDYLLIIYMRKIREKSCDYFLILNIIKLQSKFRFVGDARILKDE